MKKIKLYSPAISSLNVGDEIIVDSIKKEMSFLFEQSHCIELSTHLPLSKFYLDAIGTVDYSFVCGSNLLMGNMNNLSFRQWDIRPTVYDKVGPCILIGVGWWQYNNSLNFYTKKLYQKILSDNYIHSVRDSYTEKKLKDAGFHNVINTGCPTMWSLTVKHCMSIPTKKSNSVIFTLTDYRPDKEKDNQLLQILKANYEHLYFWLQGSNDLDYITTLDAYDSSIHIIPPKLSEYDKLLETVNVDYVGTRLHGGIRALQKGRRTIIIGVDNRAEEKKLDFNLPVVTRNDLKGLEKMIISEFKTNITIDTDKIDRWKRQFKEFSK